MKVKGHYLCVYSLLILVLLVSVACMPSTPSAPPSSTQQPPSYPGAKQVKTWKTDGMRGPVQHATFTTGDPSETILAFYKNTLLKDGWEFNQDLSTSNKFSFVWLDQGSNGATYNMTITTIGTSMNQIGVEIVISTTLPL